MWKLVGAICGDVWRSRRVHQAVTILVIILAAPSVAQYWLRRVDLPTVPASAIALLIAGALFTFACACVIYVALQFLRQLTEYEGGGYWNPRRRFHPRARSTEGSYSVVNEEEQFANEQIDELRKQGIQVDGIDLLRQNGVLTDNDKQAIEEIATAAALRKNGRTG